MSDLNNNIKEYRVANNISQAELAKKAGYTDRSSIAKIESGKVDLPQSKIIEIAKALNVSPAQLMGWEEDPIIMHRDELLDKIDMILEKDGYCLDCNTYDDPVFIIRKNSTNEIVTTLTAPALLSGYESLLKKKTIINSSDIISMDKNLLKAGTSTSFLLPDEQALLDSFNLLNESGKSRAMEAITDLTEIARYRKDTGSSVNKKSMDAG